MLLGNKKEPFLFRKSSIGRGTRTRTQNKGFGDPRVTITPYPYVHIDCEHHILYRHMNDLSIPFLRKFVIVRRMARFP